MSWTKRQLVTQSFEEIGYASYAYDLSPEQLQSGLRKMDAMVATWATKNITLGYPLPSNPENSDLDTETNVADSASEAIYLNLAIRLAPSFGKMITMETRQSAKNAYDGLLLKAAQPREMQITNLPRGAGAKAIDGSPFMDKANTDPLQIEEGLNLDFN